MNEDNGKNFQIMMKILDINIQILENMTEAIKVMDDIRQRTNDIKRDIIGVKYIWVPIIVSLLSVAGNIVVMLIK